MDFRRLKALTILSASLITGLSMIGATAGTLAWYAYSTKVTVAFRGTSVMRTEQLQVGLVDEYVTAKGKYHISSSTISSKNLTVQTMTSTKRIVWAPAGGELLNEVITEFVSNSPSLNNFVSPVSSRGRSINDALSLAQPLTDSTKINEHDNPTDAFEKDYVQIPFAFKVLNNSNIPIPNRNVWLTISEVATEAGKNTDKGVRTFYENVNAGTCFLLNPSSASDVVGSTRIAGVLDLNDDGYYDYDPITNKEIVYGQYDDEELTNGHIVWSTEGWTPSIPDDPDDRSINAIDVNGVGDNTPSTFVARHKPGIKVADFTNLECGMAVYDTIKTVKPVVNDATGDFVEDSGKPVSYTDSTGIGYTNLTIYLEGWDFAVENSIIDTRFDLKLQFEVNKIN